MTVSTSISLTNAAKYFKGLDYQIDAFEYLEDLLTLEELNEFACIYRDTKAKKILPAPYFAQLDNGPEGDRQCFSSTCAMLLETLEPGTLSGSNGDVEYLDRLATYGDTTSAEAQVSTLRSYGVDCDFVVNGDFDLIEQQINQGIPVPCGWLHYGPASAPRGGGHWSLAIGIDDENLYVHDPFGLASMAGGGYVDLSIGAGKAVAYSKKNFGPRWMVEGEGSGWCVLARNT